MIRAFHFSLPPSIQTNGPLTSFRRLCSKMNGEDKSAAAVVVELPLGTAAGNFNLEKAVCSHGLFMMAPNHWDPESKTFKRPLSLDLDGDGGGEGDTSLMVHVSHPPHSADALHLRVLGTDSLSPLQQQSLLRQVRRMLRLSEEDNRRVIEFHKLHEEAKGRGFGRIFRSPTLFEDMIKCIVLCNCQWSRALNMSKALCELQAELQQPSNTSSNPISETETKIIPKTPSGKESKKRSRAPKTTVEENSCHTPPDSVVPNVNTTEVKKTPTSPTMGNFPSPRELAGLDEKFLSKRCGLGYRAGRVIKLAQDVCEGRIKLRELEDGCGDLLSLSGYEKTAEKLRGINGFGPYTCANVLMCMGYYHVVPSDSETIRHLKEVHAKISTVKTIQEDAAKIYGKYAPFQFLAYWSEIWKFYEDWFGNLGETPHTNYKLITAANMKPKPKPKPKGATKRKLSLEEDS